MAAAKYDLEMSQGSTFQRLFKYGIKGGNQIDLTGAQIYLDMLPSQQSLKMTCSTENGHISIQNPKAGEFLINIPATVTDKFNWTKAKYQISIKFPNGEIRRIMQGTITCDRKL